MAAFVYKLPLVLFRNAAYTRLLIKKYLLKFQNFVKTYPKIRHGLL